MLNDPSRVRDTLPDWSCGPITDNTAPTPPPVQNGREPSTSSSWPIADAARAHLGQQARA